MHLCCAAAVLRDIATENLTAHRACATRGRIERLLDLRDALSEAELQRLVEIAVRCPGCRTLDQSSSIVTTLRI
ncbi:MAG: hypothetical protein GY877_02820 [Hyphomicrobium sp.]|nr:hypothetical protein [Hyphomicrobium sp.]